MVVYLEKQDVTYINEQTVAVHGGNFMPPNNFLHEENLDYLLEAVQAEMFGEPLYPAISDKAALYCYNIICNHILLTAIKERAWKQLLRF